MTFLIITKYILLVIGSILLYELLRAIIKKKLSRKFNKSVKSFIRRHNIKLDDFKFTHKFLIKQELLDDNDLHQAAIIYARNNGIRIQEVEDMVEEYIEEIVPFFSITLYYALGIKIASFIVNLLYDVVVDNRNIENLEKIPRDKSIVFVMNHRSNIDYMVVPYILAQHFIVSFAAGEWARIWPLESMAKSFGAYFIRRKFRNELYSAVLQKYIQMISMKGVTQGIFIEGALSRDGNFRESKIGILDYIIEIISNPVFTSDILFVPVGINYDWILEDRGFIKEWKKKGEKSGLLRNLPSLIRITLTAPLMILKNIIKYITGKPIRHGRASVYFGDPISINNYLKDQKQDIFTLHKYERLSVVKQFADKLLHHIGEVVPITPVPLTAKAITMLKKNSIDRTELIDTIAKLYASLISDHRKIIIDTTYRHFVKGKKDYVRIDEQWLMDDAKRITDEALAILERRKIVKSDSNHITINTQKRHFIEYYSNAINHFF
jgi:glycerol-3-phosphate O-acyltransferase